MLNPNQQMKAIKNSLQEIVDMQEIVKSGIQEIYSMIELRQLNYPTIKKHFGDFDYTDQSDGRIRIVGNWYAENIYMLDVCGHKLWVHKWIAGQLAAAITESCATGFSKFINFADGGGGHCARHKLHDIKRGLSTHAWGISVDLNPTMYPYGSDKKLPKDCVQIFNKYGFIYGGVWRTPDPMHLEFSRFMF